MATGYTRPILPLDTVRVECEVRIDASAIVGFIGVSSIASSTSFGLIIENFAESIYRLAIGIVVEVIVLRARKTGCVV